MVAFIARSALATLLLETAQRREPGVTGLWLEYATSAASEGNWRVAKIEFDSAAGPHAALAAVDEAVLQSTEWLMVEDGDPRDGEPARED